MFNQFNVYPLYYLRQTNRDRLRKNRPDMNRLDYRRKQDVRTKDDDLSYCYGLSSELNCYYSNLDSSYCCYNSDR